jgi:hypothetical protein
MTTDRALLEAALYGYQHQRDNIEAKMAEIRGLLSGKSATGSTGASASDAPIKKRTMSAAGRRRIAAAQRKRWAAQKATGEAPSKKEAPAKKKRHMSAAGRKRIADATRKRWAALREQRAAAE